jgi:hypothetical protein
MRLLPWGRRELADRLALIGFLHARGDARSAAADPEDDQVVQQREDRPAISLARRENVPVKN